MNHSMFNNKYVIAAPAAQKTNIKSRYDWKSVHAQKYLVSKSKIVIFIELVKPNELIFNTDKIFFYINV